MFHNPFVDIQGRHCRGIRLEVQALDASLTPSTDVGVSRKAHLISSHQRRLTRLLSLQGADTSTPNLVVADNRTLSLCCDSASPTIVLQEGGRISLPKDGPQDERTCRIHQVGTSSWASDPGVIRPRSLFHPRSLPAGPKCRL